MKKKLMLLVVVVVVSLLGACTSLDKDPFKGVELIELEFVPGEAVSFDGKMYAELGQIWIITDANKAYLFLVHEFRYLFVNGNALDRWCLALSNFKNIPSKVWARKTSDGLTFELETESNLVNHCIQKVQYPILVPTRDENPVSYLLYGRLSVSLSGKIHLTEADGTVYEFDIKEVDQLDFLSLENETIDLFLFDDLPKFQTAISALRNMLMLRGAENYSFNAIVLFIVSIEENAALFHHLQIHSADPVLKKLVDEIGPNENEIDGLQGLEI